MKIILTKENLNKTAATVAEIVKKGGVAILPFDTVYGIICDPRNDIALKRIFAFKKRSEDKTIGVAVSDISVLKNIANIQSFEEYVTSRIPGAYTFIMPLKDTSVSKFCKRSNTIGVRVPDSEFVLKIAKLCGGLIAQTSANWNGFPECFNITDVEERYKGSELDKIDIIVDGGEIQSKGASKIINLAGADPEEIERK